MTGRADLVPAIGAADLAATGGLAIGDYVAGLVVGPLES